MELHPDETLLQELQEVHDTAIIPPQKELNKKETCYDVRNQYEANPQTRRGDRKSDRKEKPTQATIHMHSTTEDAKLPTLSTADHDSPKNPLTSTAPRLTLRPLSLLKKTISMNNTKLSKEKNPTSTERLKCQYNDCNKTFAKKDYLRRHIMTHTIIKTFKCNFEKCNSKFNRSDSLSRHRRTHIQTTLFEYPECHNDFSRPDNLARHINKKHKSNLKESNQRFLNTYPPTK